MNCPDAEPLLFLARDGALDESRRRALAAHLEQCPDCRAAAAALAEAAEAWRRGSAVVPTPVIEKEWHAIRRRIRAGEEPASASGAWWRPAVLSLAGAAAIALVALFGNRGAGTEFSTPDRDSTYVSYVAVYGGAENTMVYEDPNSGWLVVWVGDTTQAQGT